MQKKVAVARPKRPKPAPVEPVPRPLHPPPPAIYALRVWSVKKVHGEWYIFSAAARFDDKEQWMGPYASIHRATTAIARKLAEEVLRRHTARNRNYGINE
jgi:hypothetical protein